MADLNKLYEAVLNGDSKTSVVITKEAVAENIEPMELITKHMIPAMDEVGRRFECSEYFVPELLLSARAMKSALELLRPLLAASGAQPVGRVVIGTVKGWPSAASAARFISSMSRPPACTFTISHSCCGFCINCAMPATPWS